MLDKKKKRARKGWMVWLVDELDGEKSFEFLGVWLCLYTPARKGEEGLSLTCGRGLLSEKVLTKVLPSTSKGRDESFDWEICWRW